MKPKCSLLVIILSAISSFLSFHLMAGSYKYELSACAFFQNEAPYLKEWIEYHRILGVQHFYLYNNNSEDNYLEVLRPYIKKGIVDLIDWPSPQKESWLEHQKNAYNHCIHKTVDKSKWLAIFDIDEFIVPMQTDSLREFLKDYEAYAGVRINWLMYGTSGVMDIPEGGLLTEHLVYRFPTEWGENKHVKTIVKPHRVKTYEIHDGWFLPPYKSVMADKTNGQKKPIQVDRIRINHYWTRTENYFWNIKLPRRERMDGHARDHSEMEQYINRSKSVEDKSIHRFLPELKSRMKSKIAL